LAKELERARRHGRPLSVVVLTPIPSLGKEPGQEALAACAAAARKTSRVTDLIGWLPGNRILVILPETDKDGAAAAIYRLSTEMASRTLPLGHLRWVATSKVDAFEFATADELLDVVAAHIVR
jgi:PleD family two-component response regulator